MGEADVWPRTSCQTQPYSPQLNAPLPSPLHPSPTPTYPHTHTILSIIYCLTYIPFSSLSCFILVSHPVSPSMLSLTPALHSQIFLFSLISSIVVHGFSIFYPVFHRFYHLSFVSSKLKRYLYFPSFVFFLSIILHFTYAKNAVSLFSFLRFFLSFNYLDFNGRRNCFSVSLGRLVFEGGEKREGFEISFKTSAATLCLKCLCKISKESQ